MASKDAQPAVLVDAPNRVKKPSQKPNGEQPKPIVRKTRLSTKKLLCNGTGVSASKNQLVQVLQSPGPLQNFDFFDKLPTEVRVKIWRLAALAKQRFIGFKFNDSRFKLPAVFWVNKESNYEAQKHIWAINLPSWGIIANPTVDILLLDKSAIPDEKFNYHKNVLHSLYCDTDFDVNQIKPFTKIAITMSEIHTIWRTQCIHCWLLQNFLLFLPNATELNIVLRLGDAGAKPEDMWILTKEEKRTQVDWLACFIKDFEYAWGRVTRSNKKFKRVTLNFVRFERWVR